MFALRYRLLYDENMSGYGRWKAVEVTVNTVVRYASMVFMIHWYREIVAGISVTMRFFKGALLPHLTILR
jgi:hypothetical protein